MRHFLVVGPQGELAGLSYEAIQDMLGYKNSAFHAQDFISNALGAKFFDSKNYDPNLRLDYQLEKFFFGRDRMK